MFADALVLLFEMADRRTGASRPPRRHPRDPAAESMPNYRYELRRGEEVVATGHLSSERPLEVGERVTIGRQNGIVRSVEPLLCMRELWVAPAAVAR